jgi:hypothetical protein
MSGVKFGGVGFGPLASGIAGSGTGSGAACAGGIELRGVRGTITAGFVLLDLGLGGFGWLPLLGAVLERQH